MPTVNKPSSDSELSEASHPDYSQLHKKQSTTKPLPKITQPSESRSSATTDRPLRHDSVDKGERDGRNPSRTLTRVQLMSQPPSYAKVSRTLKDVQHRQGATEDTSATKGRASGAAVSIIPRGGPLAPGPPPKDKYQQLKEEYYRIREENRQFRAIIEKYDRDLRKTGGELQKVNHNVKNQLQHESQRSKDLENELINVHRQLEDAKALSEVRGKELFGARAFLTKANTISISEVGEKVAALNEEIFQAAAALGEALIHKHYEVSKKELEAAAAVSREMVGEKISNILIAQSQIRTRKELNPLLVQVVLQMFMVKFCVPKIQSWYPGNSVIGEFLSAKYSEIRLTERQEVSGRWRALTRSNTRPNTETWKMEIYKKLQSVLIMSSWGARSLKDEDSYIDRLPSIFKAINELRTAIGEKFTSADLDVFLFECDKIYDPTFMEDAYGDSKQSSGKRAPEPIVGTTGIGLGKILGERSAKGFLQVQSLIPAKILLTSTMNEALKTLQSTRVRPGKKKPVENMDGANQDGRD